MTPLPLQFLALMLACLSSIFIRDLV